MLNMDITKIRLSALTGCIAKYTANPDIRDVCSAVMESIETGNFEVFEFCVNKIAQWYPNNIDKILENPYAFYKDTHVENLPVIAESAADLASCRGEYQAYFAGRNSIM